MRKLILISMLVVGCAPLEPTRRSPEPVPPSPISEPSVTRAARSAFRTRDRVYAEQLEAIAADVDGGSIKFDAKLQQRLDEAKAKAAAEANPELSAVMAKEFGARAMENPRQVAQSLRDMAKALKP